MEAVCTAAHLFGILNKAPLTHPHTPTPPPRNSMTAEQHVTGGGLIRQSVGEVGVTLPLPARRRSWFGKAAPGPVPRLRGQACLPCEKKGAPVQTPTFRVQPPVAADATWLLREPSAGEETLASASPGHRSPCPCHAQRRLSQQAGRQPAVLSCPALPGGRAEQLVCTCFV